jgi:hypothetical protein
VALMRDHASPTLIRRGTICHGLIGSCPTGVSRPKGFAS